MIVLVFIVLAGIGLLAAERALEEIDRKRRVSTSPDDAEAPDAWLFADGAFR